MEEKFIDLEIEKITNKGLGLSHYDGKVVFVENAIKGDKVKVQVISSKKNYLTAKVVDFIEKSTNRVPKRCALANACGGCQLSECSYEYQLEAKKTIVEDTMKSIYGKDIKVFDVIKSPKTEEFRHKVQLPVSTTKVSKRVLTGYYKPKSHELVNIKFCPNQPKILSEITEFIKKEWAQMGLSVYDEKSHSGLLRHIVYRMSSFNKDILLVFVINSKSVPLELQIFAKKIMKHYPQIKGISANFNTAKTNVITSFEYENISGDDFIYENLDGHFYKISAGSFFQVNPESATNIFRYVEKIIKDNFEAPTVLDAYCGVGSFTFYLAPSVKKVVGVEECHSAVLDAFENIKLNNVDNVEIHEGDCSLIFQDMIKNGQKFDCAIIDPPRKGADKEALLALSEMSSSMIIYVSCDPATLARDMKILEELGFKPQSVQPFDMFCHTYHVENVVVFKK